MDYSTESSQLYETLPTKECYGSNISKLYDKFINELKDEYWGKEIEIEDVPIFYPILELDNDGNEIPCLAEDYIAAVNKVSDYARLVINDLINTSKEKAKEREKAKIAEEEKKEQEEALEDEEDNNG